MNKREDSSQKKVLFLSHASLTTGFVVGSHQLAKCFASSCETYHVSSPVTPFHILKGKVGLRKLKGSLFPKYKEQFGFTDYIPLILLPYGLAGWVDRINDFCISIYFQALKIPLTVDAVLIDQPSLISFYHSHIESRKMVYRPTDIYKDMDGGKYGHHEATAIRICDGIIATSNEVMGALGDDALLKPHTVIENGVDFEFFNRCENQSNRTGFVYVGAIDFRFDLGFLIDLASHFSTENFDIFGNYSITLDAKILPPNLKFKGGIDYAKVPELLHNYKFGLLPLNDHPANLGRSPMKLYEYQASGLITLVRKSEKYIALQSESVLVYDNLEEAVNKINSALTISSNAYQKSCIGAARLQSWKIKTKLVNNFLETIQE